MIIPAKVLLFGEYAVLKGGDALAIPLPDIGGELSFSNGKGAEESNVVLKSFVGYLSGIQDALKVVVMDSQRFFHDVQNGLWFDSAIPLKSGLGSSGALVAAVVQRYADIKKGSNRALLKDLAILESHFHGNSSGIDPMVSLSGKTIYLSQQHVKLLALNQLPDFERIKISGKGSTKILVQKFNDHLTKKDYSRLFYKAYLPLQNKIIRQIVNEETTNLPKLILNLSALQLELFKEMIPGAMTDFWEEGLRNKRYAMKLCGSGGGGYLLRFNF